MKFKTALLTALMGVFAFTATARNPIDGMLERIDKGASKKFATEVKADPAGNDYFEVTQKGDRVLVRGNNYVSIATEISR